MFKDGIISLLKSIIVDYFVQLLLVLTLVTVGFFALDWYIDYKIKSYRDVAIAKYV